MTASEVMIFGEVTRELRQVWNQRVTDPSRDIIADEANIRHLYHDLKLFPSKSQVYEMVHCAREGDESHFLTFGEFCIFATELRKYYDRQNLSLPPKPLAYKMNESSEPKKKSSNGSCSYDVFLGGSCNPTVWRKDLAIPHFKSHGITFYNPQQSNWVPEMIELEHQAKQTSQLLFFVVNEKTRNVVSMIEISYLAGKKRKLICFVGKYPEHHHKINNEPLSPNEWSDLQTGLTVVNDLVERQGIPVFDQMDVALQCATKVIKEGLEIQELTLKDGARPVMHADLQIGDRLVRLREAFDAVDTGRTGKISINDLKMAFRIHVHRDLTSSDIRKISSYLKSDTLDFNAFCCIVADFKPKKQKHKDQESASAASSVEPGKSGSKRMRVKRFFSKVFHRNNSQPLSCSASAPEALSDPVLREAVSSASASCTPTQRRGSSVRDVYLGGSANGSWRPNIAVPMLKKHGLTYFNPQSVSRRLMPMWASTIDSSRVLLFVILGNSRSLAAMNEAAFYIGQGHSVVLVVQAIQNDTLVKGDQDAEGPGELLTKAALKDYNRGRSYLSDLSNREGVPVFDNVTEAVQCVIDKCKT